MKLRYIKKQNIQPFQFNADNELASHIDRKVPTLFCGFPEKTFLMLTGMYAPDKYIYPDKIPSDVVLTRVKTDGKQEAGTLCWSKNTAIVHFHIKADIVSVDEISRAMLAAVIRTARKNGINAEKRVNPHRPNSNDLIIKTEEGDKKFAGICPIPQKGGWILFGMPITFGMDYDLMRKVYKLDTTKMKEKGDVKDIREVVIGLDEIKKVDRDLFLDDFANDLAKRLELELETDDYSDEEKAILDELLPILSSEEWIKKAKR